MDVQLATAALAPGTIDGGAEANRHLRRRAHHHNHHQQQQPPPCPRRKCSDGYEEPPPPPPRGKRRDCRPQRRQERGRNRPRRKPAIEIELPFRVNDGGDDDDDDDDISAITNASYFENTSIVEMLRGYGSEQQKRRHPYGPPRQRKPGTGTPPAKDKEEDSCSATEDETSRSSEIVSPSPPKSILKRSPMTSKALLGDARKPAWVVKNVPAHVRQRQQNPPKAEAPGLTKNKKKQKQKQVCAISPHEGGHAVRRPAVTAHSRVEIYHEERNNDTREDIVWTPPPPLHQQLDRDEVAPAGSTRSPTAKGSKPRPKPRSGNSNCNKKPTCSRTPAAGGSRPITSHSRARRPAVKAATGAAGKPPAATSPSKPSAVRTMSAKIRWVGITEEQLRMLKGCGLDITEIKRRQTVVRFAMDV